MFLDKIYSYDNLLGDIGSSSRISPQGTTAQGPFVMSHYYRKHAMPYAIVLRMFAGIPLVSAVIYDLWRVMKLH